MPDYLRGHGTRWQMEIALFMTILQKPHPVTELDVIWSRFVGIVFGVIAMRLAFAFPSLESRPDILQTDANKLDAETNHAKA